MTTLRRTLRTIALLAAAFAISAPAPAVAAPAADPFQVLVFSKTTGFRHDSIPAGIAAIRQLGQQNNFTVDATEDDTQFTDANLARYAAVIFLSATGDPVSTQAEKDAFQRYIEHGGGFTGVHVKVGIDQNGVIERLIHMPELDVVRKRVSLRHRLPSPPEC